MQRQKIQATYKTVTGKLAFTLVELIIVIIILAILGTVAFMALNGYSEQSRDSARISDISSIKSTLELYQIESGKYPIPTDGTDVTYSGAVVWNQGTFGESVQKNVDNIDRIPIDPLTNSKYTYSVTQKRNEYEIAGVVEGDAISYKLPLTTPYQDGKLAQQANAGTTEATAYVTGNYNSLMNKTASGETCYVLSLPTIIASDVETSNKIEDIVTENKLVYNGFKNLPNSFRGSKFKLNGGFDFNTSKLLSYNGSCQNLENNLGEQMKLIAGLQLGYSGTVLDPREDGTVVNKGGTNKLTDLYNIYLGTNLNEVLTYLDTPNSGPLSLTGITTLSGSSLKPDTTTIKNIELFINNTGLVGKTSSTSSKTTNVYTTQEVKSCGVKYFNIGTDVTETQLALYHDGWNNPDANVRKGNRIAAANRYCSIYGCSPNAQNCVGYQPGKGFNGGGTYIESTNQIMCVGGSDTKDGELRVIPTGAMNLWNISQTDAACQSECSGAGFDNGVSVERNTSNIGCSCWDDCAGNSCKNDISEPLFLGTVQNCNAGVVSTNKNHLNCATNFIGYSAKTGDTALYVGTKAYCNAGVLSTNPNHLNCPTQFVGYAKSTGDTQLYVGTQNGCNAGVVTTNPNHLNCTTTSIGYLSTSCAILQGNVLPITCNEGEIVSNGQCIDPNWSKVSMLMRMNGTNNSTNFVDEKGINVVTRAGNSKISTTNNMYDGASGYFDGNNDYITYTYNASLYDFSTSDFTIEGWINPSSYAGGSLYGTIFSKRSSGADFDYTLYIAGTTKLLDFAYGTTSVGRNDMNSGANSIQLNTWYHVAVTRQGSTLRMFLDGNLVSTKTITGNLRNRTTAPEIGKSLSYSDSYFHGYIDEFRVTKGIARYTSNFTKPVNHYAIGENGNNALLMHFDGVNGSTNYIDEYGHNFANYGNAKISTAYSKFGGSSLYVNGTNGYIYLTDNDFIVGNQPFTLDFWFYQTALASSGYGLPIMIYGNGTDGSGGFALQSFYRNTGSKGHRIVNSYSNQVRNGTYNVGQWYHMAVTRESVGGNIRYYVDGIPLGYLSSSGNFGANSLLKIGSYSCSWCTNGNVYIDELRFTKGVSSYTGSFNIPTQAYTN